MEANSKNRFALQGVSIAQMMKERKYKSHIIVLFSNKKNSTLAPKLISPNRDTESTGIPVLVPKWTFKPAVPERVLVLELVSCK